MKQTTALCRLRQHWFYLVFGCVLVAGGMLMRWNNWFHPFTPTNAANNDDWYVIMMSAERVLDGSLAIYEFRSSSWAIPPDGGPISYPPLFPLLVSPFIAFARSLGWTEEGIRVIMGLPVLIWLAAALSQFAALIRDRRPQRNELIVVFTLLWLLLFGKLFDAVAYLTHQEGLILTLLFLALRLLPARPFWAGLCLGLALQAKQTAIFPLLAIVGVLFIGMRSSAGHQIAWRTCLGIVLGAVPLLIPFYWAQPDQVQFALLTAESRRILYGPTTWGYVDGLVARLAVNNYNVLHELIIAWSNVVLLVCSFSVIAFLLWRRMITLHSPQMYALIALGAMLQLLLGKWVEFHYYAVPLTLLALWELITHPRRLPWITLAMCLVVTASYIPPIPFFHSWALQGVALISAGILIASIWGRPGHAPAVRAAAEASS